MNVASKEKVWRPRIANIKKKVLPVNFSNNNNSKRKDKYILAQCIPFSHAHELTQEVVQTEKLTQPISRENYRHDRKNTPNNIGEDICRVKPEQADKTIAYSMKI